MRKISGLILAVGLVAGLVAGCGTPTATNMKSKLQTQAEKLDTSNYHSTATMTVQMDNGSQTYYIQTDFEAPDTYKIALGDQNKNINQIIVRNETGMFVVSPSLQKVFRFNGNWAQNQGHIYLYDQILQQLANTKNLSMKKDGNQYAFTMPMTPDNDVVTKQRVDLDASSLDPKRVVLYDKSDKAIVTIDFKTFKTGMKYQTTDFDPNKLASDPNSAKAAMATPTDVGFIEPQETLGSTLDTEQSMSAADSLIRYTGTHGFILQEFRPEHGVAGLPAAQLVDLFGIPAMYSASQNAQRLEWLNNGVEFALTGKNLTMDQLRSVAISTLSQIGK
jgi:outer membrane lipoprotein-sorting protein